MDKTVDVDQELSRGVVAYLQRGTAASPRTDVESCAATATERDPAVLVEETTAIVEEALGVVVNLGALGLGAVGRAAAAEMTARHPELSREALDALAWNVTYAWR